METESLRLLRLREAELEQLIVDMRSEIVPLEKEREQVRRGIRAMTGETIPSTGLRASSDAVAHHRRIANPSIQSLTFKQLVIKALMEHFVNGATAIELLDFFKREWGREVLRTSLSPQLSRLKNDNLIELRGKTWHLSKPVKAFGVPGLFPNENGETEASPDAREAPTSRQVEPSSAEHPTRGGSAPGGEETT